MTFYNKSIFLALSILGYAVSGIAQNNPKNSSLPTGAGSGQVAHPKDFNQSPNVAPVGYSYTREHIPLFPYQTLPTLSVSGTTVPILISTTYTNGWGQPLMTINRNNGSKDVVIPYDNRTSDTGVSYLPYADNFGSSFYNNVYTKQKNYYNTNFPAENESAYSVMKVYSDGTIPTGKSYAPGRALVGESKGTTVKKDINDNSQIYIVNFSSGSICKSGTYTAGQLSVTITEDEHQKKFMEYSDKTGKLICKKQFAGGSTWLSTYYVYDDLNRLIFVLPPKAANQLTSNNCISNVTDLCFRYNYDKYNNLIDRSTPGRSDTEIVIYDHMQRVVMSRTPNLKAKNQWHFNVLDRIGRVVFEGIYTGSEGTNYWRGIANGSLSAYTHYVGSTPVSADSTLEHYLKNGFNGSSYPNRLHGCEINQYYYYDEYDNLPVSGVSFASAVLPGFYPTSGTSVAPTPVLHVVGKLVCSKVKLMKSGVANNFSNDWITNVYFYDERGRVVQQQTLNPWNQWDTVTMQYTFSGSLLRELYSYNLWSGVNKQQVSIRRTYLYNTRSGRLEYVKQKLDTFAEHIIVGYSYDDLGRVKKKILGNVEEQNYTYNIRGQLKGINALTLKATTMPSIVSYCSELYYETGFDSSRYDGLLTGYKWRTSSSEQRAYGYMYDAAGRMTYADYNDSSNAVPSNPTNPHTWNKVNRDFTVSNLAYDLNGNITDMKQRGYDTLYAPGDIDVLGYTYDNGNKLVRVTDGGIKSPVQDFDNGSSGSGNDYTYDANGNLITDANKGVTIAYNELDAQSMVYKNNDTIKYIYDASGDMIQKQVYENGDTATYTYWGSLVIKNDSLNFVKHPEGRARWIADSSKFKYDYFVRDHQGNVRTVVTEQATYGRMLAHAGFEMSAANVEEALFTSIDAVRDMKPGGTPNDLMSAILNGSEPGKEIGAAILVHVMAGDEINLKAYGYYENADTSLMNTYATPAAMVGQLVNTLIGTNIISGEGGAVSTSTITNLLNSTNYAAYDAIKASITDPNYPRTYLNCMVFDEEMNLLPEECQAVQLTGAPEDWHLMELPAVRANKNGFILQYLSNESAMPVALDHNYIIVSTGTLLEEQHYYPHGLVINAGQQSGTLKNKYLFETNELQTELGLQLSDFHARNYDQQIGRFTAIDPMAEHAGQDMLSPYHFVGNDPANYVDPLGLSRTPRSSAHSVLMGHTQAGVQKIVSKIGVALEGVGNFFGSLGGDGDAFVLPDATVINDISGSAIPPAAAGPHNGGGGSSSGRKGSEAKEVVPRTEEMDPQYWCIEQHSKTTEEEVEKKRVYYAGRSPVLLHGVKYDLAAFAKFYDDNAYKYNARYVIHGDGTTYSLDRAFSAETMVDEKPYKPFAEVAQTLVMSLPSFVGVFGFNTVTVAAGEVTTDYSASEVPSIVGKGPSIHIHPPSFSMYHKDYHYGRSRLYFKPRKLGPSPGDKTESSRYKLFSVMVDEKYIWLYRGNEVYTFPKN